MAFWVPSSPTVTREGGGALSSNPQTAPATGAFDCVFTATYGGATYTSPTIRFLDQTECYDCISRWASNDYSVTSGGTKLINITMGISNERFYMLTP